MLFIIARKSSRQKTADKNNRRQTYERKRKNESAVQETENKSESAQQPEKTFTQSELDAAIAKERENIPSADELKAFNDWKEAQKTEQEKTVEKIKLAQEAQTAAEKKASDLEAKFTAVSKGVKPEAVDDVIALAKNKVTDTVTPEQAIDSVIEKYPHFVMSSAKPVTTGTSTPNNSNAADDTLLRRSMGLSAGSEKKGI